MAALTSDLLRHFWLLWNRRTEYQRNVTGSKISTSSTKFVFSGWSEKQDGRMAFDWQRHFRLLLLNCWTEFNKTWQEARSQRPYQFFVVRTDQKKENGRPSLSLADTISFFHLKPMNGIQRKLTGSKILNVLYHVCVFGPISWLFQNFVADENKYSGVDIPENKFSVLTKFTRHPLPPPPPPLRIKWSPPNETFTFLASQVSVCVSVWCVNKNL